MSSEDDTSRPSNNCDLPEQDEQIILHRKDGHCSDVNDEKWDPEMELKTPIESNEFVTDNELSHDQSLEYKTSSELSSDWKAESKCSNSDQLLDSECNDSCTKSSTDTASGDECVSKGEFFEQEPLLEMEKPPIQDPSLHLQNLTMLESVPQPTLRKQDNLEEPVSTNAVGETCLKTAPEVNLPNLSQPPPPLPRPAAALVPGALASSMVHPQSSTASQQPLYSLHSHQQAAPSNSKSYNTPLDHSSSQLLQVSTQISEQFSGDIIGASPQQSPTSQTGPTVSNGRGIRLVPNRVQALLQAIFSLQSPDDLQVHSLASQLRALDNEAEYRWLCEGMCSGASNNRRLASVIGAVCREAATHTVGTTKLRTMVFITAQRLFANYEVLAKEDHEKFVTCAIFLGEIFYYVRSETGTPFNVLANPLVTMLKKILQIYLEAPAVHTRQPCNSAAGSTTSSNVCCKCGDVIAKTLHTDTTGSFASDTQDYSTKHVPSSEAPVNGDYEESPTNGAADHKSSCPNRSDSANELERCSPAALKAKTLARHLDGDMMVVAKQLLQNGESLQRICPEGVADIVQAVTELLCRCPLSSTATLQVCAALAEMWPWLCTVLNPRTSHAVLASRMGLSLNL